MTGHIDRDSEEGQKPDLASGRVPRELTDEHTSEAVDQNPGKVLVECWATWCGPCRILAPVIDEIARDFGRDMDVFRVDVDENPSFTGRFGIRSVPSVLLFHAGEHKDTVIGAVPKRMLTTRIQEVLFSDELDTQPEHDLLGLMVDSGSVRAVEVRNDGTYRFLDGTDKYHGILHVVSDESIAFRDAVHEFEDLLNHPGVTEQDIHAFLERNPDLILGDEYERAHSKVVLSREEGSLIPDFFLEPINPRSLCDILELKHPSSRLFALRKNRVRFSAAVLEGAAQLREYQTFFDEQANRRIVEEQYGLTAYRPRLILIIGRRPALDPLAARRAELDLPAVTVRTYDDIVQRAKARVERGL